MAGSVNKVILVGNLGRDPEIRHATDGSKIATFSVATSESWKDRATGERKDRTEWHRVVVFNEKLSEIVEKYIKKGTKIYVEGQLQTRKWTDNAGQERYSTEVLLSKYRGEISILDSRGSGFGEGMPVSSSGVSEPALEVVGASLGDLDDEIPF